MRSWSWLSPCATVARRTRGASILGLAPPPTRRDQLAEFLRHHRERTTPESVGLPANGRRRTPGLRREEVAQLAGVGLSWYTWLEQGRDITPSASVLDALARVLDLDPPEHAHLFDLAGVALPAAEDYPTEAPAELREIVEALAPNPAYLIGPRTDVLVWNAAAARMLGEPIARPRRRPEPALVDVHRPRPARADMGRHRAQHARPLPRRARPPLRRPRLPRR